ncbi:MAG: valine--tRNA ligase, partial [Candidatus Magasanikbacteria bacterium]
HALENSLMDVMVRYQRMNGKKVLLLPGTDHAAVATQARVEKNLIAEGIEKPREHFGREGLLEKIREYAEESKATILKQVRKMGTSCDWGRLAYTFDGERSKAVNEVFKKMFNDGLIYRGYRVVNWSVKGQSTCSDDELVYVDRKAKMYTFKYSKDFPFTIATTRPETKLGDTAVAVHPEDERYKEYIGKEFPVTFCGVNLKLKVITDEHVDPEFGTGALGVTPAHSGTDFEMFEKQKAAGDEIELIQVIGEDGRMTDKAGDDFSGLPVDEAREKVVECLKKDGLLVSEEEIDQNVGTSDRFGDVVEAIPMTQWFVAVNKKIPGRDKTLKELMKEAVETGLSSDKEKQVTITPKRFEKIYYNWIDNLRDWCISRQVWWGHRIPAWFCLMCEDEKDNVNLFKKTNSENIYEVVPFLIMKGAKPIAVGDRPESCPVCGCNKEDKIVQDPDTLDTWFSSGLWTFSTLGWPTYAETATAGKLGKENDLANFHPTSWMQMGYEILFFWMARMILMSTYNFGDIPFKDVYIHGLVRNKDGKKFSKSDGNVADPLDVIEKYGTDALRYSLLSGISPGNDMRFYDEKVEGAQHLVNKLWNMCRFMLMNIPEPKKDIERPGPKTDSDQTILRRIDELTADIKEDFKGYNFSAGAERLRAFTWDELADWYLEIAKIEGDKGDILNHLLNRFMMLWHPFLPFVTEVIWKEMYGEDAVLMVEQWPILEMGGGSSETVSGFSLLQSAVVGIRSLRADYHIEPAKKLNVRMSAGKYVHSFEENRDVIKGLARLNDLEIGEDLKKKEGEVSFVDVGIEVFIDLSGVVDIEKEKQRLQKEIDTIKPYMVSLEKKLDGDFTEKAPADVVGQEQRKLDDAKEKLTKLEVQISQLI